MLASLGAPTLLPTLLETAHPMLTSEEWKVRLAGLVAISTASQACSQEMAPLMSSIVPAVLRLASDVVSDLESSNAPYVC